MANKVQIANLAATFAAFEHAAFVEFSNKPFGDVTIRSIAEQAGRSTATYAKLKLDLTALYCRQLQIAHQHVTAEIVRALPFAMAGDLQKCRRLIERGYENRHHIRCVAAGLRWSYPEIADIERREAAVRADAIATVVPAFAASSLTRQLTAVAVLETVIAWMLDPGFLPGNAEACAAFDAMIESIIRPRAQRAATRSEQHSL